MADTSVDICNSALVKVGSELITALSDSNKRARFCNEQYDKLRREVLRAHPWNFALKRAQLSQNVTAPSWGFDYAYDLPSDFIRIVEVVNSSGDRLDENGYPWKIEDGQIVTDSTTCYIRYVYNITDTTAFDPMFDEALATRLAADLAYALVQSNSTATRLSNEYKAMIPETRSVDGMGETPDDVVEGDWITSSGRL